MPGSLRPLSCPFSSSISFIPLPMEKRLHITAWKFLSKKSRERIQEGYHSIFNTKTQRPAAHPPSPPLPPTPPSSKFQQHLNELHRLQRLHSLCRAAPASSPSTKIGTRTV